MVVRSCLYNEVFTDVSCGVENGLNIEIVRARWGRSNDGTCPNELDNKSCTGEDITAEISER